MNKKQLYEHIMHNVAKQVKYALEEAECEQILEEYGLAYIFDSLNENEGENIFQRFKQPLANALSKIKQKFGKESSSAVVDIVKKAEKKGKKALLSVLTLITLFAGTAPAYGSVTSDFMNDFTTDAAKASIEMSMARGFDKEQILAQYNQNDIDGFIDLFQSLEKDKDNLYAASGVGYSEVQAEAEKMAKADAIDSLKQKYGEDVLDQYDIQFKTVENRSFNQKGYENGQDVNKSFYTVIVVAYQGK